MHNTTVFSFSPAALRIGTLTAFSAVTMLVLGFAPIPTLYYLLGANLLAVLVIGSIGPKNAQPDALLPTVLTLGVPAVLVLPFRDTSLVWAIVPVLALVVASATWMVASTAYNPNTVATEPEESNTGTEPKGFAPADELMPKRDEKTAVTNDESSATAA